MESPASGCPQADVLDDPEEKLADFVKKFEADVPDGWPLLHALWDISRVRKLDDGGFDSKRALSLHNMFVDNTGAPRCVADRCPVESGTGYEDKHRSETDIMAMPQVADIPYIHILLSLPVSVVKLESEMIAALDALDGRGVFHWESKLLFPFLNGTLVEEIRRRAELHRGKTRCGPTVRTYAFDISNVGDNATRTRTHQQALQLPEGFFTGQLDTPDAVLINTEWKFGRSARTLAYISNTISNSVEGFAVGIFRSGSVCGGGQERGRVCEPRNVARQRELVAWGMVNVYGGISMLQTLPAYQRRGLAQVVIRRLVGALRQQSLPVFAVIELDNPDSERCFEKAGFRVVPGPERRWVHYFPPGMQLA